MRRPSRSPRLFPIAQRAGQHASHTPSNHVPHTDVPVTVESAGAVRTALFNSAHFLTIATDERGVIQAFSVGAERVLGYTAAEVLHKITPAEIATGRGLSPRRARTRWAGVGLIA